MARLFLFVSRGEGEFVNRHSGDKGGDDVSIFLGVVERLEGGVSREAVRTEVRFVEVLMGGANGEEDRSGVSGCVGFAYGLVGAGLTEGDYVVGLDAECAEGADERLFVDGDGVVGGLKGLDEGGHVEEELGGGVEGLELVGGDGHFCGLSGGVGVAEGEVVEVESGGADSHVYGHAYGVALGDDLGFFILAVVAGSENGCEGDDCGGCDSFEIESSHNFLNLMCYYFYLFNDRVYVSVCSCVSVARVIFNLTLQS